MKKSSQAGVGVLALCLILTVQVTATISNAAQPTAQDTVGVHFEAGLSWSQIQAKAKAENKPIFMDCYATWCGPCKEMDKEVYPDASVETYLNEHFVCVKVQMDVTKQDTDVVKAWGSVARTIEKEYKVNAYPTFLFFSPEGKALHKAVSGRSAQDFLALAQAALDPAKQYYTLLGQYNAAKNYKIAPKLVQQIQDVDGEEAAKVIALDYIDHHLACLKVDELVTDENLHFLLEFGSAGSGDPELGSSGSIFRVLYAEGAKLGDITPTRRLAQEFVDDVIRAEDVDLKLYAGKGKERKIIADKPDWAAIATVIERKYGAEYSARLVPLSASVYYYDKKDYLMATKSWLDYMNQDSGPAAKGPAADVKWVNRALWELAFKGCSDQALLEKTITYARVNLDITPKTRIWVSHADTLANLLYKAGHVDEAIEIETAAAELMDAMPGEAWAKKEVHETLGKMKQGLPTWKSS
jgi:thioredoxin-related protein